MTVYQIATIDCYLLEAYLEDKKYIVALEKDKIPLLLGSLCICEER